MEEITGKGNWSKAIRDFGLLNFQWNDTEGFFIIPNRHNRGSFYGLKKIPINFELKKDEICKIISEIIYKDIKNNGFLRKDDEQ
jgi:hypothetical protein